MIACVIEFCGKNRFVVLSATAFAIIWALWSIKRMPLDALPDLSDTQVIIFTEWMGRSPNLIEDQITYPLVTTFLSAPKVKVVRGFTMFGMCFVYVIFEDGTDIYWARSRVLEYLSKLQGQLPEGVSPQLGPDATGVGWVYQYALIDESGKHSLQSLRSFQDWYLRYWLASVPGVAEVAGVGGYQKEYQVEIDPVKLQSYRLSLPAVRKAIAMSNLDVGGRVIEMAEHEYAVRGRGYITDKKMLELVVVGTDDNGTPITISDIARVQIGGNIRRGMADLDGKGEAVGGIVVMRYNENALNVIDRVKQKLTDMQPAFPKGIKLVPVYDRSELIKHSIRTLTTATIEEVVVVSLIMLPFLYHLGSIFIAILAFILACLFAFIPMYYLGITTNIMSLAGVIIAMGDVVDSAIVVIENAHRKLEKGIGKMLQSTVVIEAAKELGPSVFTSSLITAISFLPIFALQAQEGRLFSPLAYTKVFAVFFGAILGITLVPALMVLFIRGNIRPAAQNPVSRLCSALYRPVLSACVRYRYALILGTVLLSLATIPLFMNLGSEYMPPLDEEAIFFMPITVPSISIEAAKKLVQTQDKIFKSFPEVERVFGKVGRAETPTDPAPLSMIETVIMFKPRSEWRPGMTKDKLRAEMEEKLRMAGVQSAFTMPIKARIDMLSTGIRTPIGIKVFGDDLVVIDDIVQKIEKIIRDVPGTRSVYGERELGGFFIDFVPNRAAIARYGLTLADVMDVVESSIGGIDVTTTIEGRERYKINVRYPRELRQDIEQLKRVLVSIPQQNGPVRRELHQANGTVGGRVEQIPLGMLGSIEAVMGAPMIKNEGGSLSGWVYIDTHYSDIGGYVNDAKAAIATHLKLPERYHLKWTGQYEYLERVRALMQWVIPLTLLIIIFLLFLMFNGIGQVLIVLLTVPFALIGAVWILTLSQYNTSVAVWVGIISLLGIAAELGAMMVIYLDEGYKEWLEQGKLKNKNDLIAMTVEHGTARARPLLMSIVLDIVGLVPIMLSTGVGADVAKRMAAPLWGGLITLTLMTMMVIPAMYVVWREQHLQAQ